MSIEKPYVPLNDFAKYQLAAMNPGDQLFHGMLYPGIYPPDEQRHEAFKNGNRELPNAELFDITRKQAPTGQIARLRVLPDGGSYSYSAADLQAIVAFDTLTIQAGLQVRHVKFSTIRDRLEAAFPDGNQYAEGYLDGADRRLPQNSFWSAYERVEDGSLTLRGVALIKYATRDSAGFTNYYPPNVPADLVAYSQFWHEQYMLATTATPLQ